MILTLDSSLFVAALRQNEKRHRESILLFQQIKDGKHIAIEPYSVLIEVVAAIRRRTGNQTLAVKVKEDFLNIGGLNFVDIDKILAENAANLAAEVAVRGMDAIVIQVAKEYETTLVSFDKEMLEKAKEVVEIKDISSLL